MSKFKVGDKVKVVFDAYAHSEDDNLKAYGINIGDIGVVIGVGELGDVDNPYTIDVSFDPERPKKDVAVTESEIELVEE